MWRQIASRGAARTTKEAQKKARLLSSVSARPAHALAALATGSGRQQPRRQSSLLALTSSRCFSSTNSSACAQDTAGVHIKVNRIPLLKLARERRDELRREFGSEKLRKARQALPQAWNKELREKESQVSPETAELFFSAATTCRLPKIQRATFEYLDAHHPEQLDFATYGEMFTLLLRAKATSEMRAIFERAVCRYDPAQGHPAPEMIYRFGVSAAIARRDWGEIQRLVAEMQAYEVEPSMEIVTRVLVAQAQRGDVAAVLDTCEDLDPQDGSKWHEADVNRVITSLGIVGKPDAAFNFYRLSESRLSADTFMALLLVCRGNTCPRHALAILANRRRFGLVLKPEQYPLLLETLEQLDIAGEPANELVNVLTEMREHRIDLDGRTLAVMARNRQLLQDTDLMLSAMDLGKQDGGQGIQKRSRRTDELMLRELLDSGAFDEAAAVIDAHVRPVTDQDVVEDADVEIPSGATITASWVADLAVEAYTRSGQVAKVGALLRGLSCVQGRYEHALSRMAALFSGHGALRDDRLAYEVFLAMQFQQQPIFRVQDAFSRFSKFQDASATAALLRQVVDEIATALESLGSLEHLDERRPNEDVLATLKRRRLVHFYPAKSLRVGLQILVDAHRLDEVVDILELLAVYGVPLRLFDYVAVLKTMRLVQKTHAPYAPADYERIWDRMASDGVQPNMAALAQSLVGLCCSTGDDDANVEARKRRQRRALEAYREAAMKAKNPFVLPPPCFSVLLQAAADTAGLDEAHAIFLDAVASLEELPVPDEWTVILTAKEATEGDIADAQEQAQDPEKQSK